MAVLGSVGIDLGTVVDMVVADMVVVADTAAVDLVVADTAVADLVVADIAVVDLVVADHYFADCYFHYPWCCPLYTYYYIKYQKYITI